MEIHVMRETPPPQPLPAVRSVTLVLSEREFRDLQILCQKPTCDILRLARNAKGFIITHNLTHVIETIRETVL